MRVLFLPDFTQNNPYQALLAQSLAARGHNVDLGNVAGRFPVLSALRRYGVPDLVHLHWVSQFWQHPIPLFNLLTALRFLGEIAIVRLLGVKIVWSVHNLQDHERRNPRLEHLVNALLFRLCHQVTVLCQSAKETVLRTYRLPAGQSRKITVISHGHFIGCYLDAISTHQARHRLELPDGAPVFLFFGQIRRYKGVLELVQAFQQLDHPSAWLVIAGKPIDVQIADQLERACAPHGRIRLHLERVPDDEVQIYMRAADAVVLPFREILASSTLYLSMSFSRAVICPAIGCVRDALDSGGGIIYDHKTPGALFRALQEALSADLPAMGAQNFQTVSRLDWQRIGQATGGVYQRSFAGKKNIARRSWEP